LFGARLVMATETEQGKGWSEARIKYLTGGDPIRARRMRENFWEFPPTHKLLFSGNHRSGLRNTGVAMRRRFHLVPFLVVIPEDEREKDIDAILQQETPGILHKMIQGCLTWQRESLKPPAAVVAASKEYLDAEDTLGLWFEDSVTVGTGRCFTRNLYFSYRKWMESAGHWPLAQNAFVEELDRRSAKLGIRREPAKFTLGEGDHSRRCWGFCGIANVRADSCF
jgi:putative DNA primase/helicase